MDLHAASGPLGPTPSTPATAGPSLSMSLNDLASCGCTTYINYKATSNPSEDRMFSTSSAPGRSDGDGASLAAAERGMHRKWSALRSLQQQQQQKNKNSAATLAGTFREAVSTIPSQQHPHQQQQHPSSSTASASASSSGSPLPSVMARSARAAAAAFTAPVPGTDTAGRRRSPPLLPLYAVEPAAPWDINDPRAGWGRTAPNSHSHPVRNNRGSRLSAPSSTSLFPKPVTLTGGSGSGSGSGGVGRAEPTDSSSGFLSLPNPATLVPQAVGGSAAAAAAEGEEEEEEDPLSVSQRAYSPMPTHPCAAAGGGMATAGGVALSAERRVTPLESVAAEPIALGTTSHSRRARSQFVYSSAWLHRGSGGADGGNADDDDGAYDQSETQHDDDDDDVDSTDQHDAAMFEGDLNIESYCCCLGPLPCCRHGRGDDNDDDADEEDDDGGGGEEGQWSLLPSALQIRQAAQEAEAVRRTTTITTPTPTATITTAGTGTSQLAPLLQHQQQRLPRRRRFSRSAKRKALRLVRFMDVLRRSAPYNDHLPEASRTYCLAHYTAAALMLAAVAAVAVREAVATAGGPRAYSVADGTACEGFGFADRLRPDLLLSLAGLAITAVFVVWFALRAARYEKSGFLAAAAVVAALQLTQVAYFAVVVAPRYFSGSNTHGRHHHHHYHHDVDAVGGGEANTNSINTTTTTAWVLAVPVTAALLLSSLASVAATCLSCCVRNAFGWRSFIHGITQPATLALRRRYMRVQTCLQLYGVVALNAHLAAVFLCDDDSWQQHTVAAVVVVGVLLTLAVMLPLLRATRRWWPLGGSLAVLLSSTGYYAFVVSSNLTPFGLGDRNPGPEEDTHSSSRSGDGPMDGSSSSSSGSAEPLSGLHLSDANGRCYQPRLTRCLATEAVYIVIDHYGGSTTTTTTTTTVAVAPLQRERYDPLHWMPTAAPPDLSQLAALVNGTATYLPTAGSRPAEFFLLAACPFLECFTNATDSRPPRLLGHIAGCCASYGRCAQRDNYRLYGVLLLALMASVGFVVLVTLAAVAWGRLVAGDDQAIAAFLRASRAVAVVTTTHSDAAVGSTTAASGEFVWTGVGSPTLQSRGQARWHPE